MEFKDKLKKLRQEKNISQQKLADELHTSRSVIAKWETGMVVPQDEYIEAIANYFQIEKNELIDLKNDINKDIKNNNIKAPSKKSLMKKILICVIPILIIIVVLLVGINRTIDMTLKDYINLLDNENYEEINISVYNKSLQEEYILEKDILGNSYNELISEIYEEVNEISFVLYKKYKEEPNEGNLLLKFESNNKIIELSYDYIQTNNEKYSIKEFNEKETFDSIVNKVIESTIRGSLELELTDSNEYKLKGLKNNKFKKIIIPEKINDIYITSVGQSAFNMNTELVEVHIPSSIKEIEQMAFYGCSSLEKIIIEEGLLSIGANAFKLCPKLKELDIPNSIENIGKSILSDCIALEKLTIPFIGSNVEDLENNYIGYLFNANSYTDNETYTPSTLKEINITKAKTLGKGCFAYINSLKLLYLPNTLEIISEEAFSEFKNCESLYFNVTDKNIVFETDAFKDSEIVNIYWNGDFNKWFDCEFDTYNSNPNKNKNNFYIKDIDNDGYKKLDNVVIPKDLIKLNAWSLYELTDIKSITFEEGSKLETIGYESLGKLRINEITIPKSVTDIDGHAFRYSRIQRIIFEDESKLSYIGPYAFADTYISNIKLPESVNYIGTAAFKKCSLLKEIYIPDNVSSIGEKILFECINLEKLTIPYLGGNINSYNNADYIMEEEIGVREITITKQRVIPYECFEEYEYLEKITFGDDVKVIGEYAFRDCPCLTTVILGKGIESIEDRAFSTAYALSIICNLSELDITIGSYEHGWIGRNASYIVDKIEDIPELIELNDFTFIHVNNEYYLIGGKYKMGSINLPDSIYGKPYHIKANAFSDNNDITSVKLGKKVLSIGSQAFFHCDYLEEIILNDGLERIEDDAFNQCNSLVSVDIPRSVKYLGDQLFYLCYDLEYVFIPESVEYISGDTFSGIPSATIYVECEEAPSTWDYDWDRYISRQLVMGYKK